jgi:hypothetical protein
MSGLTHIGYDIKVVFGNVVLQKFFVSDGLSSDVSIGRDGGQLPLPSVHMGCVAGDMCSVYATTFAENFDSRVTHSAHKGGA